MHSEGLDFLSETILAQYIFNDSTKSIRGKIITPLGKEAAAVTAGNFLFTRHKKIAEETKNILEEDYNIDTNEIFLELIKSALDIKLSGGYIEKITSWRFQFSKHFIKINKELAIKIAKEVADKEKMIQNLTHLSGLYREIDELDLAKNLFIDFDIENEKDSNLRRGFMYEWGVIEGYAENYALNIWLAATSISDWNYKVAPNKERYLKSLTGLSRAFEKLNNSYNGFEQAVEASAVLALKIAPEDKSQQLKKYKNSKMTIDEALKILINYVNKSWDYFDKDDKLVNKIPNKDEIRFERFSNLYK